MRAMPSRTEQLAVALMTFADSRGHWPGCRQSRRIGVYTTFDRQGNEIPNPCSPRCRKARGAIEAAGGTLDQKIGNGLRTDWTDEDYRVYGRGCHLGDPARPVHKAGCRHGRAANG